MQIAKVNFSDSIGAGDWFWGTTLNDVRYMVEGYAAFDSGAQPQLPASVELHFWNCYGGEVTEGYAIYNYLRGLAGKGVQVETYVHGLCASIASVIALAGDKRVMDEAALFMVHKPMADAGPFADADDHAQTALVLNTIQAQIVGIYTSRAGVAAEEAHQLMNAESWLNADDCVKHGFMTAKTSDVLAVPAGAEKVINYIKPHSKPQNMAITPAEEKGLFQRFKDWLNNDASDATPPPADNDTGGAPQDSAPVNLAVTLAGDAGTVYVDTAGESIAEGDMVYTDEAMTTAAADGSYSLADGRSITVAAGAISSITEATTDAAEPVTNNAEELQAAVNRAEAAEREAGVLRNQLALAQNKLKTVPGGGENPTPPGALLNVANKSAATPAASSNSVFKVTRK